MSKKLRATTALLALLALLAPACGKGGKPTPLRDDLGPLDASNVKAALARHRGKVVVLHFWATWCTPCEKELPALVAFAASPAGKNTVLITVSTDAPEDLAAVRTFAKRFALPRPRYVLRASRLKDFVKAAGTPWTGSLPATFLYDRRGRLANHHIGPLSRAALAKRVAAIP